MNVEVRHLLQAVDAGVDEGAKAVRHAVLTHQALHTRLAHTLAALAETDDHPRVVKLAVREMPRSGKPEQLMAAYGIDSAHIADAARKLVGAEVTAS